MMASDDDESASLNWRDSIRSSASNLFGEAEPEKDPTLWEEMNEAVTMSYQNRLIGAGTCLGLGLLFAFLGVWFGLVFISPATFAVCYTLAIACFIGCTLFIVGPTKQFKSLFAPARLISAIIFFGALILTFVCAFVLGSSVLALLMIIIQTLALVWYVASYIPFAQNVLANCFQGVVAV
eukprot:TRINITY_DN6648_c0_g1_i2.p1 TRINITY_DN6648_c0_g1~~TRINITY_DN6648_c0_g1_i2.p1  ORF type:complete len:180 (-),score=26.01 TRINITY_DN6648_c0_g1_i2:135-674(-)